LNSFRGWDSNILVWDMLGFAYSRYGMVEDALFVLAKMKDMNLHEEH
jgi:pentatricopeptide repeat protein